MPVSTPTDEEIKYWEKVLHDHRLGMGRGKSAKIEYRGGEQELQSAERDLVVKTVSRKVKPTGASPD